MHWVIELIKGVRSVRAEMNVPAGAKIPMVLTGRQCRQRKERLATQSRRDPHSGAADVGGSRAAIPSGSAQFVLEEATVALPLGDVIDFAKERARLEKDLKKGAGRNRPLRRQTVERAIRRPAPEEVLAEQREKRAEAAALAARLATRSTAERSDCHARAAEP